MDKSAIVVHTVLIDRQGYVIHLWQNTRKSTLDARSYAGDLMEVTGAIAPGMRWNGEAFVSPPPRIPVEAVHAERDRRINLYFPESFREQITAFGGENALRMQRYLSDLHRTAELMGLDPPRDFKDDHRWPTPPRMDPMPVAQRFHDVSPVSPVSGQPVTIAPVFNVGAPVAPEPRMIESRTPDQSEADRYKLDINDPLYFEKLALVKAIEAMDDQGRLPDSVEPSVTAAAVMATAARTIEEFEQHKSRVHELLEAA